MRGVDSKPTGGVKMNLRPGLRLALAASYLVAGAGQSGGIAAFRYCLTSVGAGYMITATSNTAELGTRREGVFGVRVLNAGLSREVEDVT